MSKEITLTQNIDIVCDECGKNLEVEFEEAFRHIPAKLIIQPCEKCLDASYEKGKEEWKEG